MSDNWTVINVPPIIFCFCQCGITLTMKCDYWHAFRPPLRVINDKCLLHRSNCLLKKFLKTSSTRCAYALSASPPQHPDIDVLTSTSVSPTSAGSLLSNILLSSCNFCFSFTCALGFQAGAILAAGFPSNCRFALWCELEQILGELW